MLLPKALDGFGGEFSSWKVPQQPVASRGQDRLMYLNKQLLVQQKYLSRPKPKLAGETAAASETSSVRVETLRTREQK